MSGGTGCSPAKTRSCCCTTSCVTSPACSDSCHMMTADAGKACDPGSTAASRRQSERRRRTPYGGVRRHPHRRPAAALADPAQPSSPPEQRPEHRRHTIRLPVRPRWRGLSRSDWGGHHTQRLSLKMAQWGGSSPRMRLSSSASRCCSVRISPGSSFTPPASKRSVRGTRRVCGSRRVRREALYGLGSEHLRPHDPRHQ